MKLYLPVSTALAVILTACATTQNTPATSTPTAKGSGQIATGRDSAWLRRPTPPMLLPGYIFDSASYALAQQVPAPASGPLITWGPTPPGTEHPERVRTFDLRHQVIVVRLDWTRHAVVGTTTLRIAPLNQPLSQIQLDAAGMQIKKVTTKSGAVLKYGYDGKQLNIQLANTLKPGSTIEVSVAYEAVKPAKGIYFIDRKHVAWTQGETEDTHYWVPTYDSPNDKTTWEVFATTDTSERALSNGRLVGSRKVASGIEWHWSQEKPASTYLMTLVTGKYTVLQDKHPTVSVAYWTYPDSVAAAWRGFHNTPKMIDVFEQKTGVKYPWAKYDQIVVPDFMFGGMENVSATTQNDRSILIPASDSLNPPYALVSHELAHQWFGDLLTTANWGHIWLNEGFATFMESIYWEAEKGVDAGTLDRVNNQLEAIGADRKARRPLVFSRWEKDPVEVFFTGHIYPKGASILQMLRREVGDSTFWVGIRNYINRYSFQNVVSDNLREEMERASGRDLKRFFAQWVYGSGVPAFRVSYEYDNVQRILRLIARQMQPRDSLTGLFDADVDIEVLTDSGAVRRVMPVRGEVSTLDINLPAQPKSIRWDKGAWLLDVTDFPRPTTMLVHQLLNDDDISGRLEAVQLLAKRRGDKYAIAGLSIASRDDKSPLIRRMATDARKLIGGE